MHRVQNVVRPTRAVSAIERARRAWAGMALETRTALRGMGVHGELRRLDDVASGARGKAVPRGMAALATEMRDGGVPQGEAMERLTHFTHTLVELVYHDQRDGAA